MCTLGNNPRRIGKPTPHTSGGSDSNDPFIMNVYALCMTRTNVDIDDRLIADVMKRYHLPSKRRAIDYALRPVLTYLHADPVPTGVFAASSDWGAKADSVASAVRNRP